MLNWDPSPSCGRDPAPPYPPLEDAATVKSWSRSDFGSDWRPPACTGWATVGFTTLVTTAARFRQPSEEARDAGNLFMKLVLFEAPCHPSHARNDRADRVPVGAEREGPFPNTSFISMPYVSWNARSNKSRDT
jgi:hypothetical protein